MLKIVRTALDAAFASRPRRTVATASTIPRTVLVGLEPLEPRQLMAFTPFRGLDTNDPKMVPQRTKSDDPNPQWNLEKIRAPEVWGVYGGNQNSVVVVQDYGIDFRHEDLDASLAKQGQFWDYGKIFSSVSTNLRFARKGRDDFHFPVDIKKADMPANWNETTLPDANQYYGNIAAGIIGAKTNNIKGIAGINWNIQLYSAKVVVNNTTQESYIDKRANRMVAYMRLGVIPGLQYNPSPQLIRAVAFGYSSETDYGDIFNDPWRFANENEPDGAGEYDFNALGRGIQDLVKDNGEQGILVTVPTGDGHQIWPTMHYREGSWTPWVPWQTWDPNWKTARVWTSKDRPVPPGHYSPGDPDNILAVAATDIDDRPWSGNARDRRTNAPNPIDIYAPGVDIWSLAEQGSPYSQESGTRQAQAHVAGAIALLYDAASQHGCRPTYHQIREAIIEGGDDIGQPKPRLNIVNSIKYLSLLVGKDLTKEPDKLTTSVTISGGATTEGDVGTKAAVFTLNLGRAITTPVTIGVAIEDGTARAADGDFVAPRNGMMTVTIPAGETSKTFTVFVNGDRRLEPDEVFTARIVSVPSNVVASGQGLGATWAILNDDTPPTIALAAARAVEGSASRPGVARVIAILSKPSVLPVTVQYSIVNGTARLGQDFLAPRSTVITFPANSISMPIDITMKGNNVAEPDRSFKVKAVSVVVDSLSSPSGAEATVTVVDDDRILMTISPAAIVAVAGATATMRFTVTLNRAPTVADGGVQVSYRSISGIGASGATAGVDYKAVTGTLSFASGETSKTIEVPLLPRRVGQRYPKNFSMELSELSGPGRFANGVSKVSAAGRIS